MGNSKSIPTPPQCAALRELRYGAVLHISVATHAHQFAYTLTRRGIPNPLNLLTARALVVRGWVERISSAWGIDEYRITRAGRNALALCK